VVRIRFPPAESHERTLSFGRRVPSSPGHHPALSSNFRRRSRRQNDRRDILDLLTEPALLKQALVMLEPKQADLLNRVCAAPTIPSYDMGATPSSIQRRKRFKPHTDKQGELLS
jgi:hypothetical protein